MLQLSILIIEDQETARELIRHSIKKYNSSSTDVSFSIVGEAYSYDSAVEAILREDENITLVLLDIGLIGKRKNGYDVIRRFPDLSYAIISDDEYAGNKAINDLPNPNIYFFRSKEGGAPDVDDIVSGIEKFIRTKIKEGGLYSRKIRVKGNFIYWRNVVLISKRLLWLDDNKMIDTCPTCERRSKDLIYLYSNTLIEIPDDKDDKDNKHHKHLSILESFSAGDYPIEHFIEAAHLNPNDFIKISQSHILNLNYIKEFRAKTSELLLDILDGRNHILATAKGVKEHFKAEEILDKIDRHLH